MAPRNQLKICLENEENSPIIVRICYNLYNGKKTALHDVSFKVDTEELLKELDIVSCRNKYPSKMSGGEKHRLENGVLLTASAVSSAGVAE